jgi:hypothetical protein
MDRRESAPRKDHHRTEQAPVRTESLRDRVHQGGAQRERPDGDGYQGPQLRRGHPRVASDGGEDWTNRGDQCTEVGGDQKNADEEHGVGNRLP